MGQFDYFRKYIIENKTDENARHIFYKVNEIDVSTAESLIGYNFPEELKAFYNEIGYGFVCKDDNLRIDRIMHPQDIADFILGDDVYEFIDKSIYPDDEIPFFHIAGDDFLTLKIDEDELEVKYFGEVIAKSIKEFLLKMDEETDYFSK